jgi:hypothetical protein
MRCGTTSLDPDGEERPVRLFGWDNGWYSSIVVARVESWLSTGTYLVAFFGEFCFALPVKTKRRTMAGRPTVPFAALTLLLLAAADGWVVADKIKVHSNFPLTPALRTATDEKLGKQVRMRERCSIPFSATLLKARAAQGRCRVPPQNHTAKARASLAVGEVRKVPELRAR